MKAYILVAHISNPKATRRELYVDFIGSEDYHIVQELVDLMNENIFRDCVFSIEGFAAEERGAEPVQRITAKGLPCRKNKRRVTATV